MEFSAFTIRLAVLLLPGLLAAVIVERLTVHPKWEQFRFGVYSLILGISTYVIYQFTTSAILRISSCLREDKYEPKVLSFWKGMFDTSISIDSSEVYIACCFSIVLGFTLAKAVQKKWMHRMARKLGVSDKFGDENLFTFFLNSPDTYWLWVRDHENGVIYEGSKDAYSESDSVCELVLADVRVYHEETSALLYELPAIYLSYPPGQCTIEMANLEGRNND